MIVSIVRGNVSHCVEAGICSTTLTESTVYLPRKSYFLQYFGASRRAAPEAPLHSPLFVESFSIIRYVLRSEVGDTKRAIDARELPEEKFIESAGVASGRERDATSLAVLLLIFTFPLIFT